MSDWLSTLWYEFNRLPLLAGFTLGWSLRWEGGRNVPADGPALLIANHQSFLDPLAIGLATSRRLRFLARKTLFSPGLGAYLKSVGCVPVDQNGVAKEGLRSIIRQLQAGRAVLVFPEGERTWTGRMQPLKPGVSLLVHRAPAPIVPVGIAGAYDAYPRTRKWPRLAPLFMPPTRSTIAVSIGRPLDPQHVGHLPRAQALAELFEAIQSAQQKAEILRRK